MNRIRSVLRTLFQRPVSDCRILENRKNALPRPVQRSGLTMTEIIVSAVLLMTVMSFVGSICFRVNLIWSDVNHNRVAINELSNQLEVLTLLKPDQVAVAIESLEPSQACSGALKSPALTGEIIKDELGSRVILRLNWERPVESLPVELSGWVATATQSANQPPGVEAEQEGEQ